MLTEVRFKDIVQLVDEAAPVPKRPATYHKPEISK